MAATLTLPASELAKLSQAMRFVVSVTGASVEQVTRGFAGRILKRWAGKTKVVTEENIIRRARARAAHKLNLSKANANSAGITINNGARGGHVGEVWHRTANRKYQQAGVIVGSGNFTFIPSWKHWRTPRWNEISYAALEYASLLSRRVHDSLKSAHLGRQSVVQIADALGIDLSTVPGQGVSRAGLTKARAALASSGKAHQNGTAQAVATANRFFIEMINNYPKGTATGMDTTLAYVIQGEIKYYERNLAEGIFLAHSRVARAYPFLKVAPAA